MSERERERENLKTLFYRDWRERECVCVCVCVNVCMHVPMCTGTMSMVQVHMYQCIASV